MIERYIKALQEHAHSHSPDFGDGDSVLTLLYEAYSDSNRMDDAQIKTDFNELYRHMNGMELREMDKIIYPVCTLCRDHERAGFVDGVIIGTLLAQEFK